jgi:hypothetical protein
MTTLLLCSASGAPGATVTALGLTLTWPRHVLLVDADRTPSQAVLAGYLRGASAHNLGLPGVLQAHRERHDMLDAIVAQSIPLPEPPSPGAAPSPGAPGAPDEGGPIVRRFVPGFANLGSIDVFGGIWRDFGLALQRGTFDTIVDAGRVGHRGLPTDLAETSDRIGVVCRSSLVSLAALRLYLAPLLEQLPPDRVGLVLVGQGRPYRAKEVEEQFGVGVLAEIAWEPSGAADLAEGQTLPKRWRRQALATSYAAASRRIIALTEAERQRIGAPTSRIGEEVPVP